MNIASPHPSPSHQQGPTPRGPRRGDPRSSTPANAGGRRSRRRRGADALMRPRCSQLCGLHHPTTREKKQGDGETGGEGERAVHMRETETVLRVVCWTQHLRCGNTRLLCLRAARGGERWREVAREGRRRGVRGCQRSTAAAAEATLSGAGLSRQCGCSPQPQRSSPLALSLSVPDASQEALVLRAAPPSCTS